MDRGSKRDRRTMQGSITLCAAIMATVRKTQTTPGKNVYDRTFNKPGRTWSSAGSRTKYEDGDNLGRETSAA
jgi:hypothetical protein